MRVYPINYLLEGKSCVVVGGGEVASRKVEGLLGARAVVTVVSPKVCDSIKKLADKGAVKWIQEEWSAKYVLGAALVIAATDDKIANRKTATDARKAKIPVNVADDPDECDFILPSVLRRGEIVVSVGTGGASPALAAHLRKKIEEIIGGEYALAADILGELRAMLEKAGVESKKRMSIFKELVDSGLAKKLKKKDRSGAEKLLKKIVGKHADVSKLMKDKKRK